MNKRKKLLGLAIVVLGLILLPTTIALSQDSCEGNFDCDQDVDGTDAFVFKTDFGRSELSNPCPPCDPPAQVPKTGKTTCNVLFTPIDCAGTGQDGDLQKGVAWPNPRFTDNGNGTVKDNLTGLIWLKNANCFGARNWNDALSSCNGLASGACGLTDGSSAGDWRLPNRNELNSLIDINYYNPALPNTAGTGQWAEGDPFTNVPVGDYAYWLSSTYPGNNSWFVTIDEGNLSYSDRSAAVLVWPVRGGQ